ncbi:DNA-directed RNA polymerase III subunit RPC7-like [Lethenteron reissneri]|uniref:DNA-directed RNA polymerase III subunit RPC7-like n=1 Tax=Lethenteron reissneri TaxID=7753 RepID=UPI002AB71C9A|nr:DNA-directed RNA polymerase III subunit RPC7-like [Lethenteron reissneri]
MAGRGRGRGQMTFNIEAIGFAKGEALPPPTLQPPPLFPPLEYRPLPLLAGEETDYLLALKQELRGAMKNLPYFIKPAERKKDIERYSDKYQSKGPADNAIDWAPDWRLLPRELRIQVRKATKVKKAVVKTQLPKPEKSKKASETENLEMLKNLETLEQKEQQAPSDEDGAEEEEKEEGEEAEEEVLDEEEFEEETDYVMSYFENGEDFGGDSDDHMDEAVY